MKVKDINYKQARENLYCKDLYLRNYIDDMLIKCNMMFHYENLPKNIDKRILERYLTEYGSCIFTQYNNDFYVFVGSLGGELNAYYEPTKCIVNNPYLNLTKEYTINTEKDDCVLIKNDSKGKGLLSLLSKYAVMNNDVEITVNMLTNNLRTQYLISAGDNKTKENADVFIDKLTRGDFTCIAENTFLEGIKVHNVITNSTYIKDFIELNQYIKATAYNEIGLDCNFNMKRERLTVNEVEMNTSILLPLAENMLESRKMAIEKINAMYGLNIAVELNSVWKMQKENVDKATSMVETEINTEKETVDDIEKETVDDTEKETVDDTEKETVGDKEKDNE